MSLFKRSPLTRVITFRVTEQEGGILDAEAKARGIGAVDIVREALEQWAARQQKAGRLHTQKLKRESGSTGSTGSKT